MKKKKSVCLQVWAWGSASKGQLGLGDLSHRSTPTCITTLNHMGVTKVVCGTHHTAALTIDGQVNVGGGPLLLLLVQWCGVSGGACHVLLRGDLWED